MRNNTEEVKKNFLKKIKMILSIIMLSLIVVPCITSCIHGNNPNKPADKVEDKPDPPKAPTDPVPGITSDQMIEELALRKLGKINQDTYFYTFDVGSKSFKNDLEKYMNPFNLGRKKGDDTKKLYLISSAYKSDSGYCADEGLYETIAGLDTRIKELLKPDDPLTSAYIPEGSYGFNTIAESLEWRWNLVKLESRGRRFFYEQCYPWLIFATSSSHEPGLVKPKGYYNFAPHEGSYISRRINNGNIELYFINIQSLSYFEWFITFINKSDKGQIYLLHIGPYSIMKSSSISPIYPYPPEDDAEYAEDDKVDSMEENYKRSAFHMLKLSTLVRLSFEREAVNLVDDLMVDEVMGNLPKKLQYEAFKANPSQNLSDDDAKNLAKAKIADCIRINPFGKDFPDLNNWDVYLTFGIFSKIPLKEGGFAGGRSPQCMWHNTVKLTGTDADEFWGKCWN